MTTTLAQPRTESLPPIAAAAEALLAQAGRAIEGLSVESYTQPSATMAGGTIGKHLRHNLDHFRKLVDGHGRGETVAYDRRDRGVAVEDDPVAAAAEIASLRASIAGYTGETLAERVTICIMVNADGDEQETGSTLGRELAFVTHHAIHHHAMIKAIAAELGADLGHEFGLAPSTNNHEREQAAH